MSKGSKQRPMQVDEKIFSDNWDRAFKKDPVYEEENPLERFEKPPIQPEMWEHHCAINGIHMVGVGEECNWCGQKAEVEKVRITSCKDPQRWYAKHVGEVWTVIGEETIEYRCRASDGYLNFILKEDCEPWSYI